MANISFLRRAAQGRAAFCAPLPCSRWFGVFCRI